MDALTNPVKSSADDALTDVRLHEPNMRDGIHLWRLAQRFPSLQGTSAYSYVLWCRDFAGTSVIARGNHVAHGFATGYIRPSRPDTLVVWQVAVDESRDDHGLGRRMLDHLVDRPATPDLCFLEATVAPDDAMSTTIYGSFAKGRGCDLVGSPLSGDEHLPAESGEPEILLRIGPLTGAI